MAITLAVYIAVQVAVPQLVRPQLGAERLTTTITAENLRGMNAMIGPGGKVVEPPSNLTVDVGRPGAWIVANETLDRGGKVIQTLPSWVASCVPARLEPPPGAVMRAPGCFDRLTREGYRQRVAYFPADRYWTLQAIEAALFLGVALALAGGTFWWIRHRVS
jgi:hypothetical protein